MAAVDRRVGRRIAAPLMIGHSINSIRSSVAHSEEQTAFGVRSISTHVFRNRTKCLKGLRIIAKGLKKIAASKLQDIQTKTENSRGLWQPFTALLGDKPSVGVKKNVIVTIFSDKDFCGDINSIAVKISSTLHKINSGPEKESRYVVLGEMAKAYLIGDSKKQMELSITMLQKNKTSLNYTQVSVIADEILKNVKYDALRVVFNKFQSTESFIPTTSTVLSPEVVERESEAAGTLEELDSYEIEGGETKSDILQNLIEFQFSCVMFNAVLENACSEQGARLSALVTSTRNVFNALDRFTLGYNRDRQASITSELFEIITRESGESAPD